MRGAVTLLAVIVLGQLSTGCDSFQKQVATGEAKAVAEALLPAITLTALARDGHIYYSASVETTSMSLQDLLRALGLPVTVTQDGNGGVRIASATPDGARFVLVVQPAPTAPGSATAGQTNVFIEWENKADSARGVQVLVDLETNQRKKPGTAK